MKGGGGVPRMSKKRKEEWGLFLNERNRITYNKLCLQCQRDCKQSFRVLVVDCPKFKRKEKPDVSYKPKKKNC